MNILDKKSEEELLKHQKNYYREQLTNRDNINIENEFNIENITLTTEIFLINIKKFSGFEGHYYYSGQDPLVITSEQLLNEQDLKPEDSYLFTYYKQFQPKTYGQVYHLNPKNKLHRLKSTNYFHPWIHHTPTNTFRAGLFGPKDISSVKHRLIRLRNLINNINSYGYIPSNNDVIEGYILLKNNDYRFLITGGHHRVAVLTAMYRSGKKIFEHVAVKYDRSRVKVKIVREKEVTNWPGVKSGYLHEEDALEMFNKYFNIN